MSCCSNKPKIFGTKNGKILHEFNCSSCGGFITVKLDEDLNGAHCVVCPNCSHEHYRIIKDGVITEDRAPSSAKSYATRICPTKAAYSKTSWESKLANRKTKVAEEGKHLLGDLWKRVVDKQKQTPPEKKVPFEKPVDIPGSKGVDGTPRTPTVEKPDPKLADVKPEVKVDGEEVSILDELIAFCVDRKKIKVAAEEYHSAAKWRDMEKKIKFKKESILNGTHVRT